MNHDFLRHFNQVEDVIGKIVQDIKAINESIVLFGAGYCASMVIDLCETTGIKIHAIVDNNSNRWGEKLKGINIKSWEDIINEKITIPVLISTSHYKEILSQIEKSNYKGHIFHLPLEAYYKNTVYGLSYIEENADCFATAYTMLADECSRKVFLGVMKHNISLDNRYYEEIEKYETQGYFGTDLYKNREDEIIVDVGAFNGDTIQEFLTTGKRSYKAIYAFEPDTANYQMLEKSIVNKQKIVAVCAGLGEKCGKVNFRTGEGVSSKIDQDGTGVVEIETLDHFFSQEIPTFIKMDIEGGEKAALMGGKNIIAKYHPTLVVSAYHKKEDLFDLIDTIQSLGQGQYDIYLRHTFYYQAVKVQPDVVIYALERRSLKQRSRGYPRTIGHRK